MSLTPIASAPQLVPQLNAPANVAGPVTLRDELALWTEAFDFAKAIAGTDLVPKAFRNNPPAVMAVIIKGHELGVPALHALSQIHVIEGRPCVAAELQRALILAKGHELWTEDYTTTMVTLCGRRHDGDHVQKVTWTMDDAKRAQLAGKPNWRNYPRAMLLARTSGELGRLMFADVLAGLGVNLEELGDGVTDTATLPDDPQPAAKPRTTRRTTARKSAAPAARSTAQQGPPASPGPEGPPPPLPDEDDDFNANSKGAGYDGSASGGDAGPDSETTGNTASGQNRPLDAATSDGADSHDVGRTEPEPAPTPTTDEPAEVVTKRAQAIAMRAQRAGFDHHDVIAAVTHGNKTSAKTVTAAEADAVLHALVDLEAGRLQLIAGDPEAGEAWNLVEAEPGETKTEEYQRRIRELRAQRAELDRGGQQTLDDQENE